MARNKTPPESTKWKKGVSPNPGGRPKILGELAAVQNFTDQEAKRIISKYLRKEKPALQEAVNSTTLPSFEMIIASSILKAIQYGEYNRVAPIIERVIGKVKENVDVKVNDRPLEKVTAEDISKILQAPVIDVTPEGLSDNGSGTH